MKSMFSADGICPMLPVSNIEAACEYFRDKLGFTIDLSIEENWGWAIVGRGTSRILLVPEDGYKGCLIQVDDVDAVCDELRKRGAEFESGPMNQPYGERDFLVR